MNFVQISGILGGLGVVFGAFGAHGLKNKEGMTEQRLQMFSTGAHYQMIHAVAIGALGHKCPKAAWAWIGGSLLFSGSLYLYGYTGTKTFGMIAPIGGTLFIVGWAALALS